MRFLFILKDRLYHNMINNKSYGLSNSAQMVSDYLDSIGNECKVVSVIDSNFIDREVYSYKPDCVIIEALWVSGDKMKELLNIPRYSDIIWVIRIHSDIGFLSAESRALTLIKDYIDINSDKLIISTNNKEFNRNLSIVCHYRFEYLPNIITIKFRKLGYKRSSDIIDIGSFGALRLLKNQVFQAMCSIEAANRMGKELHFHINGDIQNSNNSVMQNMLKLFEINREHKLYVHGWMEHDDFEKLISSMDLGLQLSYTESFNIVSADFVNEGVNIIVSESVDWMPFWSKASTVDYNRLIDKIRLWYWLRNNIVMRHLSRLHLLLYNRNAKSVWRRFVSSI